MNAWRLEFAVLAAAVSLAGVAVHRLWQALPAKDFGEPLIGAVSPIVLPPGIADLEESSMTVIDANPFRLSRTPASVRFGRAKDATAPAESRPTLTLRGIVGGPPWQAVVDGIPGVAEGTVVRTGSLFDRYRVISVSRDSVIVLGPDTTWRLTMGGRGAP